ncbi:O-antigen ligase family protein [Novosphingobium sp.]|uniref:O-antigen ligase family protein n=1 Tax=Novosphingobium sp. TaxID=1874826 RepID=UPI003D115587
MLSRAQTYRPVVAVQMVYRARFGAKRGRRLGTVGLAAYPGATGAVQGGLMEQFSGVIFATLPLFCLSLLIFVRRPLHATIWFLIYRSIVSVAAYLHIPGIGSIPFFVPAFLSLWAVIGLYHAFVSARLPRVLPVFSLIAVAATMIVSTVAFAAFNPGQAGGFITTTLKFILPVGVYLGAYAGLRSDDDFRQLPRLLAAFLIVPVSVGIAQSLAGWSYDYAVDAMVHGMRPVGTIIDPNAYGIFLCMGAFLVTPFAIPPGEKGMRALLAAIVLAIVLSRNRGSWICAVSATAIGIALYRRYFNLAKVLSFAAVLALLAAPVVLARFADLGGVDRFGQSQDTFSERIAQSRHLLEAASQAPLTGYGAGSAEQPWGTSTISRPPHDDYVRMIYEFGVPACLLYVLFLCDQVYFATRIRAPENWTFGFSATCFMIYVMLISLVQNLIYDSIMYSTIMLMMAITHRKKALGMATV